MDIASNGAVAPKQAAQLPGVVRKLRPSDSPQFRDHLLRLDSHNRRLRFGHAVADSFVSAYAGHMSDAGSVTYAYVEDGTVRAAAELKPLGNISNSEGEAALSVEPSHQDMGLGTELLGRVIRSARNRGLQHVRLNCHIDNERMRAVARKHEAGLHFAHGEVTGDIIPDAAPQFSIFEEAVDDGADFVFGILDLQTRLLRSYHQSQSNLQLALE